ncbi:MAG: hypothetical protein HZC42_03940 [Candidatus Eisenbacteria bacterium]|nr:hypothetical protein [Candidatus Eisenbacteria bacterium]
MPRPRIATLAALLLLLAGPRAHAQTSGPPWIALDTQPPGTPASVQLNRDLSDGTRTTFDILVHGFYLEPKIAPDGSVYSKITVPGMGSTDMAGAPDLPAVQLTLALPQGIAGAHLAQAARLQMQSFSGMMVWPRTIPEMDDSLGTAEQFVRDDSIYALPEPWPAADADGAAPASPKLGSIMGARLGVYPFHWSPLSGQLDVASQMQVRFDHDGAPAPSPEITRRRARVASDLFPNWDAVSQFYPANPRHYYGEYLIVLPYGWQPYLQPLIDQKSERGFHVALRFIPSSGNTCDGIRTIIRNWYYATPSEYDHYCLLVGETDVIPYCSAPANGSPPTDDLYSSMDGDDLDQDVYVGRLSAQYQGQVASEVWKILTYMDDPPITDAFKRALLVAHEQGAPGKYEGAQESVYNASYSDRPNFVKIYGSNLLAHNSLITYEINAGLGLVCYRGHGSANSWGGWNGSESYSIYDLMGLTNGTVTPVVWNLACSNHDLPFSESMGEWWLLRGSGGAVGSYGATTVSNTNQNHELDRQLFKAVYDLGLTTQAHAIQYAEAQMAALAGSYNAWLYNLLGDPEMPIRRERPLPHWAVYKPAYVNSCTGLGCAIAFSVVDTAGQPVPNLQISLWKPPAPPAPNLAGTSGAARETGAAGVQRVTATDEVFDNTYTDPNGDALVPAAPQTPGHIYFTLQDDLGNTMLDSIEVVAPTGVPVAAAGGLRFAAQPSVARGWTRFDFGAPLAAAARVTLVDVAGRVVRTLVAAAGETGVRWLADDDAGRRVPGGIYFARLETAGRILVTRVAAIR